MPHHLIPPHGGVLRDLMANEERRAALHDAARDWPSWDLLPDQLCELELLLEGAFSPLAGFMTREDHEGVIAALRLADGTFWPSPVALAIPAELARRLAPGGTLALRDAEGVMLAALTVAEVWRPDPADELATLGYFAGASVAQATRSEAWYVGGAIEGVQLPAHYDFAGLRPTPRELRAELARLGWRRVVGYQTSRPLHRAEHEATLAAAKEAEASLLIHVVAGKGSSADVGHFTLVRCCQAAVAHYPQNTAKLALLPYVPRQHRGRDLLLRALVARGFGCTHFLVEAADDGSRDAVAFAEPHAEELGVRLIADAPLVYLDERAAFVAKSLAPTGSRALRIDEVELRRRLAEGREIPSWFSFPEVVDELRRAYPPRHRQGLTVFFTGLSGAGKSTVAAVLLTKLLEMGGRPVTLLDGDIVRKHLSSELGFSKEHRDINIRRIGFVASEITKNGGIAICAPIAPYDAVRKQVREMVSPVGGFVLVHVSTPLAVCEQRDRKGLYAKARAGIIPQFTGISDPYEEPADAEVVLDTSELTPEEAAQEVLLHLERAGYIGGNAGTP